MGSHAGTKYALLSFDTESDIGSWTQDYTSIDHALPLISSVLKQHNIKGTFLCEGMAALHNEKMIRRLFDEGHEIGCHSFKHETLGDCNYFIPGDRAILEEEIPNRLRKTTDVLQRITGRRPTSFRAPRLWGNAKLNNILEDLGYLIDSSLPICSDGDPLFPYHPDRSDWHKPGNSKLLEVPVFGVFADRMRLLPEQLIAFAKEFDLGSGSLGQWPVLRLYGAVAFKKMIDVFAQMQMERAGVAVACIYLHPWEFIPMPGVLEEGLEARVELRRTLHEGCGDKTLSAMDQLIDLMKSDGYEFLTLDELRVAWEHKIEEQ